MGKRCVSSLVVILVAISVVALAPPVYAQNSPESTRIGVGTGPSFEIGGSIFADGYGDKGWEELEEIATGVEMAIEAEVGEFLAIGHVELAIRSTADGQSRDTVSELGEAVLFWQPAWGEYILGFTAIDWSPTTFFSPTDVVNPRSLTRTAVEPEDQYLTRALVSAEAYVLNARLQGLVLPAWINGFPEEELPDPAEQRPAGAGRIVLDQRRWSGALVGYLGPASDYGVLATDSSGVLETQTHVHLVLGANLEARLRSTDIMLDAAWRAPLERRDSPSTPDSQIESVVGIRPRFLNRIDLFAEYSFLHIIDQESLSGASSEAQRQTRLYFDQSEQFQHRLGTRITISLIPELFEARANVTYNASTEEYLVVPSLQTRPADGVAFAVGVTILDGPTESLASRRNDRVSGLWVRSQIAF